MKKILAFSLCLLGIGSASAQTYAEWVEKSATAIEKKDYVTAEIALKSAMRKEPSNPNNVLLLNNLGTILRYEKKYDEALTSYNAVLEKYPNNATLLANRASLFCEMEKWDEALLDYNHIIASHPDDYEAYRNRALLLVQKKKFDQAEADFQKLETLKPEKTDGALGKALIARQAHRWQDAEEIYTTLIYKHRSKAELYAYRSECYLNLKKLGRTSQDIEKAIELGYTDPYIYVIRGQLRMKQYDKGAAIADFEKARSEGFDSALIDEYIRLAKIGKQ